MTYRSTDALTIARIMDFLAPEIRSVRSNDELRKRLAKFGYGFRDTVKGRMLTTAPHGVDIAPMPSVFANR